MFMAQLLGIKLNEVIPSDWKYDVSILNDTTIKIYITEAPVDLLAPFREWTVVNDSLFVDHYYLEQDFSGETLDIFTKIFEVIREIKCGDVYYRDFLQIRIGAPDQPFKYTGKCVHTEHCCEEHGCKYGDADCPVVLGEKPQSFLCEQCIDEENEDAHFKQKHESVFKDAERYRLLRECTDQTLWGQLMSVMPFSTEAFDRILDEYKIKVKK